MTALNADLAVTMRQLIAQQQQAAQQVAVKIRQWKQDRHAEFTDPDPVFGPRRAPSYDGFLEQILLRCDQGHENVYWYGTGDPCFTCGGPGTRIRHVQQLTKELYEQ